MSYKIYLYNYILNVKFKNSSNNLVLVIIYNITCGDILFSFQIIISMQYSSCWEMWDTWHFGLLKGLAGRADNSTLCHYR